MQIEVLVDLKPEVSKDQGAKAVAGWEGQGQLENSMRNIKGEIKAPILKSELQSPFHLAALIALE